MTKRSVLSRYTVVVGLLSLASGCAAVPPRPRPEAESIQLTPDRSLARLVARWAERYEAATGVAITVGEGGKRVRFVADAIPAPDGTLRPGATNAERTEAAVWYRAESVETATGHEIGHLLGGDHCPGNGVLGEELGGEPRRDVIDAASLESICGRLACLWMRPEE